MFIEIHFALFEASTWSNMFALDAEKVTYLEKIIRPLIVYFVMVLLLRIFGKRELAELNPIDFVLLLLISEAVQNAIIGDDTSLSGGVIGVATLLAVNYTMAFIKFRVPPIERLIEGSPKILIENGKINQDILRRELMTDDDLEVMAHEEGLDSAKEIEKLVLDPNGTFLVEAKHDIKDAHFKKEVLEKIDKLTEQLKDLQSSLQKS
jgi:uncharacterized membrane protein YcaP (DUF421 family)